MGKKKSVANSGAASSQSQAKGAKAKAGQKTSAVGISHEHASKIRDLLQVTS
jgi:hypothetical protein